MREAKESCRDNALTRAEADAFKAACASSRPTKRDKYLCMYYIMAVFGLRIGEYVHFKHAWIDMERYGFKIPPAQKCDCKECVTERGGTWSPKTKAGVRFIPGGIDPVAFEFIEKHYGRLEGGGYRPYTYTAYDRVKDLSWRARIEHRVYPHSLRATAAMRIASLPNVNAAQLQAIMGWESLETANHYIRASGIDVERAFPIPKDRVINAQEKFIESLPEDKRAGVIEALRLTNLAEPPKGTETPGAVCSVCDGPVIVETDGSWVCNSCGATSNMESPNDSEDGHQ